VELRRSFVPKIAATVVWLLGAACSEAPAASPQSIEVPTATDVNPADDVVEVQLVAEPTEATLLPGTRASVWAYRDGAGTGRGTIPGPLIRAKQGDRIIVHLHNDLPEATTIHWHGVRVPPESDGTLAVQAVVEPGAEFTYDFIASDAGTFWYHPHVRGDVQIERGLYGMLIVSGGTDVPVDADRAFVLDDVKLEADGSLSTQTDSLDIMLGRQGNVLLVNGRMRPTLAVKAGGRERWRLANAANGRYFNLRLGNNRLRVISWDGGLLAQPYEVETLLIAPGERYEILVEPTGNGGDEVDLETIHYDRGHDIPDPGPKSLMTVKLVQPDGPTATATALPTTWGDTAELDAPAGARERSVMLSENEVTGGDPVFLINGVAFPDVPPIEATTGDVETWTVRNDSEMDHPFHLHGMFFKVLDVGGAAPPQVGWKDTVNVPRKQSLRFAVRYGAPGTWMYHCHILEHAERGMMAELVLSARP
jgi:FtsP/CotA-like multicopper oxidase with cupredoxin domain